MESMSPSLLESRRGFLLGTVIVFLVVFITIILGGTLKIPEWTEYLAIVAILAQVLLIHRREQALYASRRWRFWYALVIAGFACDLMTKHLWWQGYDTLANPIQARGQLLLGGLFLFYVMVVPIMLSLIFRTKKS